MFGQAEALALAGRLLAGQRADRIAAEVELLHRCVTRDRTALHLLFRPIAPALGAATRRLPPAERPDVHQEIMRRLLTPDFRGLRAFDPTRGTLLGFIYAIARNEAFRWLTRNRERLLRTRAWPETFDPPDFDRPDHALFGQWRRAEILAAVPRWFPRTDSPTTLVEYLLDGLEPIEIARLLGLPEGTVTSFITRLRARLRSEEAHTLDPTPPADSEKKSTRVQGSTQPPGRGDPEP